MIMTCALTAIYMGLRKANVTVGHFLICNKYKASNQIRFWKCIFGFEPKISARLQL